MASTPRPAGARRKRFSPLLWLSSLAAVGVLSLGITGTLSQFTAAINNPNNEVESAGPASFGFSETLVIDGQPVSEVCAVASAGDSVNCDDINKNGELGDPATPILPGQQRATTVRLENTAEAGGLSGDLTLTVETCTQVPAVGATNPANNNTVAGNLCDAIQVTLACDGGGEEETIGPLSLTDFAASDPPYAIAVAVPPGGYRDCTFTTAFPVGAAAPNLQGIETSQPMTWTFTQTT